MRNDFRNDASYEERVEQFRQEQKLRAGDRAGTTYHALAGVDQALEGGEIRGGFARVNRWRNS